MAAYSDEDLRTTVNILSLPEHDFDISKIIDMGAEDIDNINEYLQFLFKEEDAPIHYPPGTNSSWKSTREANYRVMYYGEDEKIKFKHGGINVTVKPYPVGLISIINIVTEIITMDDINVNNIFNRVAIYELNSNKKYIPPSHYDNIVPGTLGAFLYLSNREQPRQILFSDRPRQKLDARNGAQNSMEPGDLLLLNNKVLINYKWSVLPDSPSMDEIEENTYIMIFSSYLQPSEEKKSKRKVVLKQDVQREMVISTTIKPMFRVPNTLKSKKGLLDEFFSPRRSIHDIPTTFKYTVDSSDSISSADTDAPSQQLTELGFEKYKRRDINPLTQYEIASIVGIRAEHLSRRPDLYSPLFTITDQPKKYESAIEIALEEFSRCLLGYIQVERITSHGKIRYPSTDLQPGCN